jgi:hypothetical protein
VGRGTRRGFSVDALRPLHYHQDFLDRPAAVEGRLGPDRSGRRAHILDSASWRGTCAVRFVTERRHSGRLPVQIPIVLRGKDDAGREFFDRAQIVSIDDRGARIHTRFGLTPGSEVTVELPGDEIQKRFRVSWSGEPEGFYDGMAGLEFADDHDAWTVESLKVRWEHRNT